LAQSLAFITATIVWVVDSTGQGGEWIMHGQGSSVTQLTWRTPCNHHPQLYQTHLVLGVFSIHCVQQAQQCKFGTKIGTWAIPKVV
jgi:hypothetical protein